MYRSVICFLVWVSHRPGKCEDSEGYALHHDDECSAGATDSCGVSALQHRARAFPKADEGMQEPVDAAYGVPLSAAMPPMRMRPSTPLVREAGVSPMASVDPESGAAAGEGKVREDAGEEAASEGTAAAGEKDAGENSASGINEDNWQTRVACVSSPYSNISAISAAVSWACGAMQGVFDCGDVPETCKHDPWRNSDYILGIYYRKFGSHAEDCDFGGVGLLSPVTSLSKDQQECMVEIHDVSKDATKEQELGLKACVARRSAEATNLNNAISWACGQMDPAVCNNIPVQCVADVHEKADFVFGSYSEKVARGEPNFDCSFGGAGQWSTSSTLRRHTQACILKVKGSSATPKASSKVCHANRKADKGLVEKATKEACEKLTSLDCGTGLPQECSGTFWQRADFIFGTYMNSVSSPTTKDCDFGGVAKIEDKAFIALDDAQCTVNLQKPLADDGGSTPQPQPHTSRPVKRPPPQTPNDLPTLDEASVSHYARFTWKDKQQLAGGCMPGRFYDLLQDKKESLAAETPHVEGWYQAAAPIWMTQPMHGRNSADGQTGIGVHTTWFDYNTGKPHLPNGPATGMMFDQPPVDGYDTSDGCWEATWDDEHGEAHRVGFVVMDNCGHSDGIENTVHNIKWCVPFRFTDTHSGATCPIDYFDKCFPEKQAAHFGQKPWCQSDFEVIGNLHVTNNAPWAKMVIGTYTEEWCPDPNDKSNCRPYLSPEAAKLGHTISWTGEGSARFESQGKCVNHLLNLPPHEMPDLGSCSANAHATDDHCRNAYGFPYHFDVATFEDRHGNIQRPPWGMRNTRVYGVQRVSCPKSVKQSLLNSCGIPDLFVGNNLVWGSPESSYVPPHWCKTSLQECLASPLYRQASLAFMSSIGHAFCHSETCKRMHRLY